MSGKKKRSRWIGALAALSAVSLISRYSFYRKAVSAELKKQLAPVHRKLDRLEKENEALRAELAARGETEEQNS